MNKELTIPNELRFVRALALAVDPGDTLTLLLEIGALQNQDLGVVRRTREALGPAYDRASDRKDWEQTHTVGVLQQALAAPDSAAYLAYQARGLAPGEAADRFADALAMIGCAADTLGHSRRPWEIEPGNLSLPEWREWVRKLLFAMPGHDLSPSNSLPGSTAPLLIGEEAA